MLVRWGIRVGTSLAGVAVGILVSSAVLSKFSIDATAVVEAILIFWLAHLVVQLLALSGLRIHGFQTYVFATLIIWVAKT